MRQIIESEEFRRTVEQVGGARAIDEAMEPLYEALNRNPYGFDKIENDFTSFRYARIKPTGDWGIGYVIAFTIEHRDVILQWIDEDLTF